MMRELRLVFLSLLFTEWTTGTSLLTTSAAAAAAGTAVTACADGAVVVAVDVANGLLFCGDT